MRLGSMKTLLVDDNQLSLDILHEICAASLFAEIVREFTDPMEALDFVGKNPADFALLDVEMPKMSGIDLGEKFSCALSENSSDLRYRA